MLLDQRKLFSGIPISRHINGLERPAGNTTALVPFLDVLSRNYIPKFWEENVFEATGWETQIHPKVTCWT